MAVDKRKKMIHLLCFTFINNFLKIFNTQPLRSFLKKSIFSEKILQIKSRWLWLGLKLRNVSLGRCIYDPLSMS